MKHLWLTSSMLVAAGAIATNAQAQNTAPTPAANDAAPTAEIIVTAQKRTERLQDVPVAVSVVSGDALAKLSTVNIEDTQRLIPALTFLKGDTSLNSSLFLRGLGTINFSIAAEPSVSTVIDGVVLARAGEGFGDLYELDRIEVLRGPQGTLFGKNASAGVVNIITKEPGRTLSAYVDAGYFDRNEYKVKAGLSGPIGGGWRAGITGFYSQYDGNIYDTTTKGYINGYKHYGGRLQLVGDLTENLKIKIAADYRKASDSCCGSVIGAYNATAAIPAVAAILPPAQGDATRTVIQSLVTATYEEAYGGSLEADLSLGRHTLTSITGYRKWNNEEIRDGDWVDQVYRTIPLIHDDGPEKASTFTQELRLASPTGGFVDYVVGAFYYHAVAARTFTRADTYCTATTASALPSGLTPCPAASSTFASPVGVANFGSTFDNIAAYGQATWHLGNKLRLITGLRYTHDKLDAFHSRVSNYAGIAAPGGIGLNFDQGVYNYYVANNGAYGGSNGVPWTSNTSKDNVSGKAGLEYQFSRDHIAYATYSRGYKGPAYNVFFNMASLNTGVIAPETVDSYEAGLKNSFDHGRVVLNIAAFYAKYHNYQANYPTTVNGTVTTTLTNAGDVSTRGFEVDWLARIAKNFSVTGGFSYTDAHVDQFLLPPGAPTTNAIASGTPLPFAPKTKGSLGLNYTIDTESLPFGVELGAQGSFQDSEVSTLQATNTAAQISTFQNLTVPAYGQVDLSIAAVGPNKRYRVAFIVKNVFNETFPASIATGGPGGSYLYLIPRDANRYWGVTARFNFGGK